MVGPGDARPRRQFWRHPREVDGLLKRRTFLPLALAGLGGIGLGAALVQSQPKVQSLEGAVARRVRGPTVVQQSATPPGHVSVQVSTQSRLRAISPLIYGVAVANKDQLTTSGARLNRWGGNPNTRYNWQEGSAWNSARDWEFRNYGGAPSGASSTADAFVSTNRALGVQSLITVPAIGWVASNGDNQTRSVDVPATGGPPLSDESEAIAGYDPTKNRQTTSVRSVARMGTGAQSKGVVRQDDWIRHLVEHFGQASSGGVGWYVVDNEPDLWSITHTDIHPVEPSYDEMVDTFLEYAGAIKDVDPTARVLGPALSGWTSLFYSARDRGSDNFKTHTDRAAHGDQPFLPWWLSQIRQHDEQDGRRTLDALDVHYYPQANGVYSTTTDAATNALRVRSTRSLWDPNYVDESWINDTIMLIPRLRAWIDQNYPGTLLAINEWNWGADNTMNGALAIANVLGIFGREGVDMAAYWVAPPAGPGASAFSLFTNYDGHGGAFGDRALAANSDHPDDVAVYASRDNATGDMPLVLINQRTDADIPVTLSLSDATGSGSGRVYRLSNARPDGIQAIDTPVNFSNGSATTTLPAESITLVRLNMNSTGQ